MCGADLEGVSNGDPMASDVGVPTRLGSSGVEGIVEIGLTDEEQAMFEHSASAVQGLVEKLVEMDALRDPAEG